MGIPILRVRDENGNVYAIPAIQGAAGNGIASIALKSGTHASGTTDTYEITFTDGTTFDFFVYNGANGTGVGDMLASTYDPQGKVQDIFAYVDNAVSGVTVTTDATPTQGSTNPVQSGGVYTELVNKLDKTGDGSNVTAAFTAASSRTNIATGEKLSILFSKIAKWFSDFGSLAFKSTVAKTDLASDVQTSLGKADTAIQQAGLNSALEGYVAKNGTDRLMTMEESTKLDGIDIGAQKNVIETVKVGGTALTVTEKAVDITAISTDLLTQGAEEIIFNCGSVD